ncbi:polyketide synthase dehydratase domain-containing protein, partial [Microbispora amethystogenes]|uniref:polyketide synthase dehydratase domain-containing protein n=1 Tax=Microbispora amethystogenes TaxID=1427754 RepID=UPI0031E5FD9C
MPEGVQAGGFAVHPALLDAVLQATDVSSDATSGGAEADAGAVRLPFAFGGVSVFAAGASLVRVRITPVGDAGGASGDAVALEIADASGAPVASVESYVCRAMSAQAVGERVYRIDWVPAPITTPVAGSVAVSANAQAQSAAANPEFTRFDVPATSETPSSVHAPASADAGPDVPSDAQVEAIFGAPSEGPSSAESSGAWAEAPSGVLSGMRSVVAGVLERVQEWVAVPEPVGPLVVVTRGAVGLPGEDVDVSVAPVWGLV